MYMMQCRFWMEVRECMRLWAGVFGQRREEGKGGVEGEEERKERKERRERRERKEGEERREEEDWMERREVFVRAVDLQTSMQL
jgi:hypothetical protein